MDKSKNKPVLCSKSECTGCEACKNSCPESCINMQSDDKGFLQPIIDYDKCIGCNKCEKSCPILNKPLLNHSFKPVIYACWHKSNNVRMRSSSGGAFSAIAEKLVEAGGIIYGAAYDDYLHVHHIGIAELSALDKLRRSKYVQSSIGLVFREIRDVLTTRRSVLFVGTPCQVAGLYTFLGEDHPGLITCDLICHGVPSPKIFSKYITWLENNLIIKIKDVNFRDKRKGWRDPISIVQDSDGEEYLLIGKENSYLNGFNMNVFLRESCYACQFKGLPRYGDLTLGDYWGIGKRFPFFCVKEEYKGISLILTNTAKGQAFLSKVKDRLILIERQIQEVIEGNSPLSLSMECPMCRDNFFRDLDSVNYEILAERYFKPPFKSRVRIFARERLSGSMLGLARKVYGYVQ